MKKICRYCRYHKCVVGLVDQKWFRKPIDWIKCKITNKVFVETHSCSRWKEKE